MAAKSTDLVPFKQYAVAAIDEPDLVEALQQLAEQDLSAFDLPTIKVPSGGGQAWEIPSIDGPEPEKYIEGVLLDHRNVRVYWADPFDGGGGPPDCSSADSKTGFGYPLRMAGEDVTGKAPQTMACAECPQNQWGSKVDPRTGEHTRGKACAERKILLMMRGDGILPYVVNLPPSSLAAAKNFVVGLVSTPPFNFKRSIIRIGLRKVDGGARPDYSEATFSRVGTIDGDEAARIQLVADKFAGVLAQARVSADGDVGFSARADVPVDSDAVEQID